MIILGCIRKGYALYCYLKSDLCLVAIFIFLRVEEENSCFFAKKAELLETVSQEQGKQANHKHGDFIDFSQEFLFSLSPGQTIEQIKLDSTFQLSWIQHCSTVWPPMLDGVHPTFLLDQVLDRVYF